jgi:predicted nucleic acid-binding protein
MFQRFAPAGRRRKGRRPEELLDPATSRELGIQENDLWIAAQALQYNYVLVSHDQHMSRIREVSTELRLEDWAIS